jgi:propanol-preferring alcohol dehydrogenase
MRAQLLRTAPGQLSCTELPDPQPGPCEVRLAVRACGVCRTDLHLIDGELADPVLPMVPGNEIVGIVTARGPGAERFAIGERVGVPWLGWACSECRWCRSGRENLCPRARFTGCHMFGGYAEETVADERFCVPLPPQYADNHAAPLLCAGLIGYRALGFTASAEVVGLYGFGAAAHIAAQVLRHQGRTIFAFTRPGDVAGQDFALSLGAAWVGGSDEPPPRPIGAAVVFAPVGALVRTALQATEPGGVVVCAGIHMSDIPAIPYRELWSERVIRSVANLTRADATAFMDFAARHPIETTVQPSPLAEAGAALERMRRGITQGAEVLVLG